MFRPEHEHDWATGNERTRQPGYGTWDVIYDNAVSCARVSSLFVYNNMATRFVEIGWYEDPSDTFSLCLPTTSGAPRVLAYAFDMGMDTCDETPAIPTSGQWDAFKVSDPEQDGVWSFFHDATLVFSEDMGSFVTGILRSNGERHNMSDGASADFNGLQRMNFSASWVSWDSTTEDPNSDDSGYKFCKSSNTYTSVRANATPCP